MSRTWDTQRADYLVGLGLLFLVVVLVRPPVHHRKYSSRIVDSVQLPHSVALLVVS
jgi:hypothetical protein